MNPKSREWTLPTTDVRAAWQCQIEAAAADPTLAAALWPRFAAYYERLRRLPRRWRRALRRQLPVSLAGAALLLALGQGTALAATITVDGMPCTLVDAITAANSDTATGGCAAGSGADTLDLQTDVTLGSTYGPFVYGSGTGLPEVTSEITITGNCTGNPGNRCTIERDSGAPSFRLVAVAASGNLTLDNLTLSGGLAIGGYGGGGVFNRGTTTLTNSTLSGNSALNSGGGVYNMGTTTITNSTLSGNSATAAGGVSNIGTTTITNSTLSGNSASSLGGGLLNIGTTTITNSTLSGNSADSGGGVFNRGTTTLTNSTLSGNSAGGSGGGVFNIVGTTTITNSTLSGNSASSLGGGLVNLGNTATTTITNSTLSGNSATIGGGVYNRFGTTTLAGALISGNTASSAGAELFNSSGSITADNYNLFGHDGLTNAQAFSSFTPGATYDRTATSDGTNPTTLSSILDTLAANGGPTETHALVSGSPAIDQVPLDSVGPSCATTDPDGHPLTVDQRSFGRPAGTICDIGAFEFDAVAPTPTSAPDCALLGNQSVSLGNGTTVHQGSAAAKVCSNAAVSLGANVKILDGGHVQQAYAGGASAGQVLFNNNVQVSGDVLANGDLLFGANGNVGGAAQAGLDLNFRSSGNHVTGACRYGDSIINHGVFGNSCGSTTLEPTPPFAAAFALPTCTVTANGGPDIAPPANINYGLLPPGDYGHVRFGNGTTVKLDGAYTFKSLAFGYNNRIEIGGPSTLQVEQQLTFGNGTQQTLTGGTTAADIVYRVHSSMTVYSQTFGANTVLYGTICAPEATIRLGNGTEFEGAVYADSINVGYNVNLTTTQAPLP